MSASSAPSAPRLSNSSLGPASTKIASSGMARKLSSRASATSERNRKVGEDISFRWRAEAGVEQDLLPVSVDGSGARTRQRARVARFVGRDRDSVGDVRADVRRQFDRHDRAITCRYVAAIDESGIDGALVQLADDPGDIGLAGGDVVEDRLRLVLAERVEDLARVGADGNLRVTDGNGDARLLEVGDIVDQRPLGHAEDELVRDEGLGLLEQALVRQLVGEAGVRGRVDVGDDSLADLRRELVGENRRRRTERPRRRTRRRSPRRLSRGMRPRTRTSSGRSVESSPETSYRRIPR